MTYQFETSTELMKNQKAAQVLSDQSPFQVLQSSGGQSLFFSISDTNILYLSAEQDNLKTGWVPIDLTTELATNFPGQTVTARTFAVCQSTETGAICVAQILHIAETGADHLYVLEGLSNAPDAAWLQSPANRTWIARPYDDAAHPVTNPEMAYVNIPVNQDATQTPYFVVGIQDPATSYIQNYIVNINPQVTTGVWTIYQTAENYNALQGMRMGKPESAMFPGLYELYTLDGAPSLTFTPLKSLFGPPDITKLTPPEGASSLAVLPADATGATNVYVAGTGGIFLYPAGNQENFSTGTEVITNPLIENVQSLEAHVAGSQVTLWGRTNSGVVFYSRCPFASQTDPSAWSSPIPIQQGVDQLATLLDLQTQSSILYAHTSGQTVAKLTQDPVTTQWRTQSILLPLLNIDDVVEFYTYTTHITVVDENSLPLANQAVSLTATSPGAIYLNDSYMTLSPTIPLQIQSDPDGTVTLVQETQTLGAICYNLTQGDGSTVNINPMSTTVQRMQGIKSGADLGSVKVTDEKGNTSPLVPTSIPQAQKDAAAQAIGQFVQTSSTLPQDGSLQSAPSTQPARAFNVDQDTTWGLSFANSSVQYSEGVNEMAAMGLVYRAGRISLKTASIQVDSIDDAIEAFAGDIFKWIEGALDDVKQFFVQVVDGVTHFFIQIGESLYHFVMNCINDVVHAIQFILNKIEVTFEKLVQWLGFIFSWDDILRTHNALKNIFKQYAIYCAGNFATYRAALENAFTNIQDAVNQWAGLPDVPGTAGSISSSGQKPDGSDSPQSHYGSYHAKNNASSATTDYAPSLNDTSELQQLLDELVAMLQREESAFTTAYENLKTQVVDQVATISSKQIVERLIAIIFDMILESLENAALTTTDILGILVEGVVAVLDAPIEIPLLSWLYKEISGNKLTILDLVCLVAAIPVTVICKLVTKAAPFPDNDFTQSVIAAPDFATIQRLYQGQNARLLAKSEASSTGPDEATILALSASVCAYFGAIGVMCFGTAKFLNPTLKPVAILYAVSYLFYVAPDVAPLIASDSPPTWDVHMNETVCGVSVLKTLVDISLCTYQEGASGKALTVWNCLSPGAEAIINGIWQVPVCVGLWRSQDPSSIVGFIGNTFFDAGGWITPGTSYPEDEKVKAAFFLGTVVCSAVYGELMLVQGLLDYNASVS